MIPELERVWRFLVEKIFPEVTGEELFNQYKETDKDYDVDNAWKIRRDNFRNYLDSFERLPGTLIVGEAPSYCGMRFSGVPFTSELQLCGGKLPFKGHRSSAEGRLRFSRTSNMFWNVMLPYHQKFLGWECVLFHPHEKNPLSNRTPSPEELAKYGWILDEVWQLVKRPEKVVAVGRTAEDLLVKMGIRPIYVTHPAALGKHKGKFKNEILRVFDSR